MATEVWSSYDPFMHDVERVILVGGLQDHQLRKPQYDSREKIIWSYDPMKGQHILGQAAQVTPKQLSYKSPQVDTPYDSRNNNICTLFIDPSAIPVLALTYI